MSDSYERVIGSLAISRPVELTTTDSELGQDERFFLRNVCSIRIMEDSTEFEDLDEIERERISLLNWLSRNGDPDIEGLEKEIRPLVRASQINLVRSRLDQTKVDVDEAGIRSKIAPVLRERHQRYLSLSKLPEIDYSSDQITKRLGRLFEGVKSVDGVNLATELGKIKLPSTEKNGILADAFVEILEWFLLSPEFGLDAHLSSNIRHGTFFGHSRRSFTKRKLLLSDVDSSDPFAEDSYWGERCVSLGAGLKKVVGSSLKSFSKKIDAIANEVNDSFLQLSLNNSQGLF
ncbi:MAG: hypothetical protein ACRYGG_19975, partial [Janthinobacterium lividum]